MNTEAAKILNFIADFLEMEGVNFKPFAYRKAAEVIEAMRDDIAEIYEKGGLKALEEIPGVGVAIARKLEEYIKTGHLKYYEELAAKTPVDLANLLAIEGLGPKKVKMLYEALGVRTVEDLEKAVVNHQIAGLPGFGEKTEENIRQGIAFVKKHTGRFLLGFILPRATEILEKLRNVPGVKTVSVAGSLRRMRETIGDVDILAVAEDSGKVMDVFTGMVGIDKIWGKGHTKSSVRTREGFDIDLRVVPAASYGAALQYFTGSKEHNIRLRTQALVRGMKLNEYGLFKGKKLLRSRTEEDIYRQMNLDWIPPELREDSGELEAAAEKKLPRLVRIQDIRGDLHCHSSWDGGRDTIEKLAEAAKKRGYEYIGIADHTQFLKIERGLDEAKLLERNKEIDRLNAREKGFRILKGCEANILGDGSIDIADTVLAQMDFVIAGVHSQLKMEKTEMMRRIIRAMENPHVDIISHPTGRLLEKRDEYHVDMKQLLQAAHRTGTVLEINSSPERLDLNAGNIREAKKAGVAMIINTDSHEVDHMRFMELGVGQARRGWAEKEDIINTGPVAKLLSRLKHGSLAD